MNLSCKTFSPRAPSRAFLWLKFNGGGQLTFASIVELSSEGIWDQLFDEPLSRTGRTIIALTKAITAGGADAKGGRFDVRAHLFKDTQIPVLLGNLSRINQRSVSVRVVDGVVANAADHPLRLDQLVPQPVHLQNQPRGRADIPGKPQIQVYPLWARVNLAIIGR